MPKRGDAAKRSAAPRRSGIAISLLAAIALAGCQTNHKTVGTRDVVKPTVPTAGPAALLGNTDPSAMKLHDISGGLLMYYAVHHKLPENFQQLQEVADIADGPIDGSVPGTNGQYVYTRDGIHLQDLDEWIVVYEPAPMHNGQRAVVVINQPHDDEVLQTKVVTVPEQFFLLRPATPIAPQPLPATPTAPVTPQPMQKPMTQPPAAQQSTPPPGPPTPGGLVGPLAPGRSAGVSPPAATQGATPPPAPPPPPAAAARPQPRFGNHP